MANLINLNNLTKEDLIVVIANMHDTIQKWDDGFGLPKNESDILNKVGSQCSNHCSNTNTWNTLSNLGNESKTIGEIPIPPQWVRFSEEKPSKSGMYYWKSHNGRGGFASYYAPDEEFDIPVAFEADHYYWLKEANNE